jgi:hypothetical protein
MEDNELRDAARKRLEDKRGFWNFAAVFLLVSALLIGIWAISGAGFFWPMFPIGGMGIGLALQAWSVYGQKPITESDIEREAQRQRQRER